MDHDQWYGGMDVDAPPLDEVIPQTEFIDQDWLEINYETIRTEAFIQQVKDAMEQPVTPDGIDEKLFQQLRDAFPEPDSDYNDEIYDTAINLRDLCVEYLNKIHKTYVPTPRHRGGGRLVVICPGDSPSKFVLFANLVFQTGPNTHIYTFPSDEEDNVDITLRIHFLMFPFSAPRRYSESEFQTYLRYIDHVLKTNQVNLLRDFLVFFDYLCEGRSFRFLTEIFSRLSSRQYPLYRFRWGSKINLMDAFGFECSEAEYAEAEFLKRRCVKRFDLQTSDEKRTPDDDVTRCNLFLLYAYYAHHHLV